MRLENKVALVTGGGRGIGRSSALALAKEGAKVAVAARTLSEVQSVAEEIRKMGADALAIQVDVSKEVDVERMVEKTVETFGRIDILLSNAGVNLMSKSILDVSLDQWNWLMGINLTGAFLSCKAVMKRMIQQKSGKIIIMSTKGGRWRAEGRAPYRPSKAALVSLAECLSAEGKRYNINVNAICPALVNTKMAGDFVHGDDIMQPEEIADIVVFLASDESRALQGSSIYAFGKQSSE